MCRTLYDMFDPKNLKELEEFILLRKEEVVLQTLLLD